MDKICALCESEKSICSGEEKWFSLKSLRDSPNRGTPINGSPYVCFECMESAETGLSKEDLKNKPDLKLPIPPWKDRSGYY